MDFSSAEGRALLAEAMAAGTAEAFFPLVAQLHTQAEPAWCGLGTLVTVLNALQIDPGRRWKGPWRWFGEELLSCCKSLDLVAAEGLTLAEVGCLARCNGAWVQTIVATADGLPAFREALEQSVRATAGPFVVAAYDRQGLGQTGNGHYSPLAAWHPGRDLVLILDVARFKYPPHWAPVERLFTAMQAVDSASGTARGWLLMDRADTLVVEAEEAESLARKLSGLGATGVPCCPPTARETVEPAAARD